MSVHVGGVAIGIVALWVLNRVVSRVLNRLRKRGQIYDEFVVGTKTIGLSTQFAAIEQFLIFLATVTGKEVLAAAAGGWLVLKGIHAYARWGSEEKGLPLEVNKKVQAIVKKYEGVEYEGFSLDATHCAQGLARNRFLVFSMGTALSITAGAIAGAVYHGALTLLDEMVSA